MIMIERLSSRLGALECLPEVAGEFEPQWSLICKRVVTKKMKKKFRDRGRQVPQKKSDCREHASVSRKKGREVSNRAREGKDKLLLCLSPWKALQW